MGGKSAFGGMDLLGAHMSIAAGVAQAPLRAVAVGCRVLQIFTSSNARWEGKAIDEDEAALFRARLHEGGIAGCVAHAGYLINLCAPDPVIRRRSIRALADEITRCGRLGIAAVVVHVGCHKGTGERSAIGRAARALDGVSKLAACAGVKILLENSAGSGTSIGYKFGHLAAIRDRVRYPESLGFCFDTCHAFAAGYDLRERRGYEATFAEWSAAVGAGAIELLHVNDCKGSLGSRRDRHEHIGFGQIGLEGFRLLLNDPLFAGVPKVIETPKERDGFADRANLRVLRGLMGRRAAPAARPRWRRGSS